MLYLTLSPIDSAFKLALYSVELALYEDPQGTLVLFVVHGGVGVTAFEATVCAPHGNVTVSRQDIGSWLVSVASVGEGGASWWKW